MTENESAQIVGTAVAGAGGALGLIIWLSKVIKTWAADRSESAVQRATTDAIDHWKAAAADAEARCQKLVLDLAEMTNRANSSEREKNAVLAERGEMEKRLSQKISELEFKLDAFGALIDYLVSSGKLNDVPPDVLIRVAGINRTHEEGTN